MDSLYLRYASAILDIAISENKVKEYKSSLNELDEYFASNLDVKKYLETYMIPLEDKEEVVNKIANEYHLDNLSNFLCVLIKNHRFHYFNKFVIEFNKIANENLGILSGVAYSVSYISKEDKLAIEEKLSNKLGKKVELENRLDESLIGGIKIFVDDKVFDGSLKGKIQRLGEDLKERRHA